MAEIKIDATEVETMFKSLRSALPVASKIAMKEALNWAIGVIPVWFIRGPRPDRLVRDTGNLEESLKTRIEVRAAGESVGVIRSTARSERGFDYGAYWEYYGTAHAPNKPRPFLSPLIEERQDALNKVLEAAYIEQIERKWR